MSKKRVRINSRLFWTSLFLGTLLSSSAFAAVSAGDLVLDSGQKLSDIVKNAKFKIASDRDELRLVGLVPAGCKISLAENAKKSGITLHAEGCDATKTSACTTDNCIDLGASENKVALDIHDLKSGEIQFSHEDKSFSIDDDQRFQLDALSPALMFTSKADRLAKEQQDLADKKAGEIDNWIDQVKVACKSDDLEEIQKGEKAAKQLLAINAWLKGKKGYEAVNKDLLKQEEKVALKELTKRVEKAKFSDSDEIDSLKKDIDAFNNKHDGYADDMADLYLKLVDKRIADLDSSNLESIKLVYGDVESLIKDDALALDGLSSSKKTALKAVAENSELDRTSYLGMGKAKQLNASNKQLWSNEYNLHFGRVQATIAACGGLPAIQNPGVVNAAPLPASMVDCGSAASLLDNLKSINTSVNSQQDITDKYLKSLTDQATKDGTTVATDSYTPGVSKVTMPNYSNDTSSNPAYGVSGNNYSGVPMSNLYYGGRRY